MVHLSVAAVAGAPAPKRLSLAGTLQGQSLSILLVDSGSSHTFLSSKLAPLLSGVQPLCPAIIAVQDANGEILYCTSHLLAAVWSVQGCSFTNDLKLLALHSYNMILGIDRLSSFSPMQVHWQQKWLAVVINGATAILLGDAPELPVGSIA